MSNRIKNFLEVAKKPLIVILGPTASGKTDLSIRIAQKFNGEIISTDSRQIYKEMEIGTAAITKDEQRGVLHHMLGITTPDKTLTMAEYVDTALQKIEEIYSRKHIPILVGGTGLYISAIIQGYDVPRIPPNPKLREELEKIDKDELHKQLKELDPSAAEKIHPNNKRYTIRAMEVAKAEKRTPETSKPHFDTHLIGIKWPREELYERINHRVDMQIERGLLDEVKKLIERGYDEKLPALSSLGVKEIIPHLKGESTLEECLETLKQNTRHYAKRQMTWFRRYDNVEWINNNELENYV